MTTLTNSMTAQVCLTFETRFMSIHRHSFKELVLAQNLVFAGLKTIANNVKTVDRVHRKHIGNWFGARLG